MHQAYKVRFDNRSNCEVLVLTLKQPITLLLFGQDLRLTRGLPRPSVVKPASQCRSRGDVGLSPGSGRSPGGENGNPLQYSCLENPMDRAACQATVHGVTGSRTRLSDWVRTQVTDLRYWLRVPCTYSQNIYSVPTSFSALCQELRTQRWGGQKRGLFSGKKKKISFSATIVKWFKSYQRTLKPMSERLLKN